MFNRNKIDPRRVKQLVAPRGWYEIRGADADVAEVFLYDEIGEWFGMGVGAKSFVDELEAITASTIRVRINSPGGSVFDGLAIFNALKRHRARIETHVDGWAASIASVIAMAGDEIVMADSAFLMIHNAWSIVIGNADDMRKEADVLDKVDGEIARIYAGQAGDETSLEQLQVMMAEETWFTSAEALDAGLIDRVEETESDEPEARGLEFVALFENAPPALAGARPAPAQPDARVIESALRDAGFSKQDARWAAHAGVDAINNRRCEADGSDGVAAAFARLREGVDRLRTEVFGSD